MEWITRVWCINQKILFSYVRLRSYFSITSKIGVDYAILAHQLIDSFPLCLFWVLSFIYQQNGVGGGGLREFRTSTNRFFFVLSVLGLTFHLLLKSH